jgi:hypothetical protein
VARPGGVLVPQFPDGGYAAARAGLPPDIVLAAHRADLNLRDLYRRTPPSAGRTFADIVWEELNPPGGGAPGASPDPGGPDPSVGPAPVGPSPDPQPIGPPLGVQPIGLPLDPGVGGRPVSVPHPSVAPPSASAQAPASTESPPPAEAAPVAEGEQQPAPGDDGTTLYRDDSPNPKDYPLAERLPMNMESVERVAEKYGIDLSIMDFKQIDKVKQGPQGSTGPDKRTRLYRYAFLNEEELARTLVHERYHVEQLNAGMGYPTTYDAGNKWEKTAQAYEDWWWENVGSKVE